MYKAVLQDGDAKFNVQIQEGGGGVDKLMCTKYPRVGQWKLANTSVMINRN